MNRFLLLSCTGLLISTFVMAGPAVAPAKVQTGSAPLTKATSRMTTVPTPIPPSRPRANTLLWDAWYTITVNGSIHYAYFNERFEVKDGKLFYQSKSWKQEEGYLNEEQLGELAEDTPDLQPLFFNFHSTYRTTETKIDGNFKDKILTIKVRKGNTDIPVIKKALPSKIFFSSLFPVWLSYRLPQLKVGQSISFMGLIEDNLELNFDTTFGQVRREAPDAYAMRTKTNRLSVNYRDLKAIWYVQNNGMPIRIEIPAQKTIAEMVSKEKAQSFLDE